MSHGSGLARSVPALSDPTQNLAWRLAYVVLCLTLAALVLGMFVHDPGINGFDRVMFADMIHGDAHKPFVYRTLLPTTPRVVVAAVPAGVRARLEQSLGSRRVVRRGFNELGWERQYLLEYGVALILMYLSLCGFLLSLRYLFTGVYAAPRWFLDLVTLAALLGLPPFFRYYSYLYDFPGLLLFTLGLGLMVRRRWTWLLLVFFVSCFNKETTALLTLVFAIHFFPEGRRRPRFFWGLVALQLGLLASIKLLLYRVFLSNPGPFVDFHLVDHNSTLTPYGLPVAGAVLGMGLLVFHDWSQKPAFLRHAIWISVPLLGLTLFLGYLDEMRDYYEAYPIILLLASASVARILGVEVESIDRKDGQAPQPTDDSVAVAPLHGAPLFRSGLDRHQRYVRR